MTSGPVTSGKAARGKRSLVSSMAALLTERQLPGNSLLSGAGLGDAARFVLDAARTRRPGQPSIAVESVSGPIEQRRTRIAIVNDDMPFLVDSIAGAITAAGLTIDRLLHPVVAVSRDARGNLQSLSPADASKRRESIVYVETARADARTRVTIRSAIEAVLTDVRAAVHDWPAMQAAMAADADRIESGRPSSAEDAALLRWLRDNMLTQLGHVTRRRDGTQTQVLGVCRSDPEPVLAARSYERAFAWFGKHKSSDLLVIKSNEISRVHRRVPFDLFIVPVREKGKVTALSVHAGIWTSAALAAPPAQVPRLREHLARLMDKLGFDPRGHAGKALVHAMTRLPHDWLIAFDEADMERVAATLMSLVDRPRSRLVLVQAPLERHLFAFVWLPRETLSTAVRHEVAAMLSQAARAAVLDWSVAVESGNLGELRFVLDIRDGDPVPDEAALDTAIRTLVRGWPEAVEAALADTEGTSRAAALAARYAEAFPLSYRTGPGAAEAACDIARLRRLERDTRERPRARDARIVPPSPHLPDAIGLKLYQRHGPIELSDAVPMLENFGFRVAGETPTLLDGGELGAIHDFDVCLPAGLARDAVLARTEAVEAAISAVVNGTAEDDAFNRLITVTGLAAREADWLRAWFRYLRQGGMTYGIGTVVDALQGAPEVTHGLIDLFVKLHDPAFAGDRDAAARAAQDRIADGLSRVSAINDDRLLRQYRALVLAILRTNAFTLKQGAEHPVALAFKIDSSGVPGLPRPLPWREIFVYSRRVEGIHLRAGPIARGGLRWSDRRDDFRTEVLGLMKAQRVKNAVIVPTGAKGGFYPKQLPDPSDRDAWLAEGKASYEIFVRSLLSLTDNIVGRKVVHPRGMVIRDGDDPYFVVAADKGTASYSDTANAIAAERDFWLDDAFASGGSKGYDHKAMGITARGAWISVRRHFMELGVDVQTEPVRVAGCGDMSGDVFGNGMLLSRAVRLVAAFDHRHVFLDPDPDPVKSWKERKRLFDLPRSSWNDYDKTLISKGGGVFPRSQKAIALTPQVRGMLGLDMESADPDTLISAILRAEVDLLWFGGIGTYIKATAENDVQVGDPANDSLRVNGAEVRARVVGEGANLGCTQAGRIEYALRGNGGAGGRINADFIDNSAGVDCSDNEVNIKIALASAKREGRLTEKARVRLLADMTDEVAGLVLEDNRLQTLALSVAEVGGASATPSLVRLIEMLEERGHLDRRTEGLADGETLLRRAMDGDGLTRPELAVLLSSAKLALQDALEHSPLPDDPGLADEAVAAFPARMRRRFREDILEHRLRREIIATELANHIVNRMGIVHPFELVEEEGATQSQVVGAFVAAERLFGMAAKWRAIEEAAMPERARILLFDRMAGALRPQMADLLRAGAGSAAPSALVEQLGKGVKQLEAAAAGILGAEARAQSAQMREELLAAGAPAEMAGLAAELYELDGAVGIARLSADFGIPAPVAAAAFIELGAALGLDWAQAAAARANPSDPWERLLVGGLARDFQQMRLDFLRRGLQPKGDPAARVAQWTQQQAPAIRQFRGTIARARKAVQVTPAMLAQLAGQARNLLAH
ncbi:MAG: NAD-glutamate dehydrogenase [Novosphingobium sp.]|nr:NAD-glutamate dehydrogenase [Novosphingobium sp.]